MKKKIVAALGAALLALALPTAALAYDSISGSSSTDGEQTVVVTNRNNESTSASLEVKANGTGTIYVEPSSAAATNAPSTEELAASGYHEVGSFEITADAGVQPPYGFSYNIGSQYGNYNVVVYIQHSDGTTERVETTTDANGNLYFTTQKLSVHTVVATTVVTTQASDNTTASSSSKSTGTTSTNKGNKSPQTGVATLGIAGVAVAAGTAAVVARKKSNK